VFRRSKPLLASHLQQQAASERADLRFRRREERRREAATAEQERQQALKRLLGDEANRDAAIQAAIERAKSRKRRRDADGR
jgi:hypothetical protein